MIKGDGIGPEVVDATLRVLNALGQGPEGGGDLEYVECEMGLAVYRREGKALLDDTMEVIRDSDAILLGAIMSPPAPDHNYRSGLLRIRQELDLFANVRPARSLPNTPAAAPDLDMVLVRENTEGLYGGRERELSPAEVRMRSVEAMNGGGDDDGTDGGGCADLPGAEAVRRITDRASERVVRKAFQLAEAGGRTMVTAVHKANVLPLSEGVFLRAAWRVAEEYEPRGIEMDAMLVDAAAADLVRRPGRWQVLVTTNMFGDILSDLAAQLAGGLGLAPSANLGVERGLFEPVHGSAPDIAGRGIANPTGCILSSAMMLDHLGLGDGGDAIRNAVEAVYGEGRALTPDVGGEGGTDGFTGAVLGNLRVSGQ